MLGDLSSFFLCMQKAADLICSANRYRCMQKSWEHLVHRCESVLGRWLAGVRFPRQQLHFQKKKKRKRIKETWEKGIIHTGLQMSSYVKFLPLSTYLIIHHVRYCLHKISRNMMNLTSTSFSKWIQTRLQYNVFCPLGCPDSSDLKVVQT